MRKDQYEEANLLECTPKHFIGTININKAHPSAKSKQEPRRISFSDQGAYTLQVR